MPLDWLNTPLDADIGDLIARKKRAKTIELLRSQLQGRMAPPVQMRLQLADLLVQAGREAEAVPILIGLADEFAGDGFVAKAIAILKRVDKVQPGREDVESRLARLVRLQRSAPAERPRSRRAPEFGIEEIADEPADEPADAVAESVADEAAGSVAGAASLSAPEAAVEPPPIPIPRAEPAPPPPAETDTARRVRGVFRRFLASLPGASSSAERAPVKPVEPPAASGDVAEAEAAAPEAAIAPTEAVVAPPEAVTTPTDAVTAPPEAPITAAPPVPDAASEEEDTRPDAVPPAPSGETVPDDIDAAVPAQAAAPPVEEAAAPVESDTTEVDADAIELDEPEPFNEDTRPDIPLPPAEKAEAERDESKPSPTEPQGVGGRIRGALKWLWGTAEPEDGAPTVDRPVAAAAAPALPDSPTPTVEAAATDTPTAEAPTDEEQMPDEVFQERLLDLAQDILRQPGPEPGAGEALDRGLVLRYAQRLLATALFGDLSEEELLAVVRGLRLHLHGPGDILVTEGERGQSVFVLASGSARVFVRSPSGRNFPVAELREGEFFGEISSLSGRPRSATLTATSRCELLELDRPTLDDIARHHPRVADVLEEFYIRRASSPEAAAIRAVPMNDAGAERKAIEVLEAHFGQSRWDPRMRLRLADVLLKAGKYEDAVPVLIGLADDLAREGYPEKAIAVLKKIEKIRRRDIEVVNLAPRRGAGAAEQGPSPPPPAPAAAAAAAVAPAKSSWSPKATAEFFEGWLADMVRDRAKRSEPGSPDHGEAELGSIRGYGPGLSASPLFEDFTDDELLAVIRGLRLLSFDTGDIIITEGEPGQSLFVLTTGTVKVFVRDRAGRNVALVPLGEGAFFGEIATLSGRPRSATVTAASRCELLELDKPALEAILKVHPRVRDVLEEHYIARAGDPEAAAIRGTSADERAREEAT